MVVFTLLILQAINLSKFRLYQNINVDKLTRAATMGPNRKPLGTSNQKYSYCSIYTLFFFDIFTFYIWYFVLFDYFMFVRAEFLLPLYHLFHLSHFKGFSIDLIYNHIPRDLLLKNWRDCYLIFCSIEVKFNKHKYKDFWYLIRNTLILSEWT